MKLTAVRIKNYQSLEDASFDGLSTYNAVVGVNNSGKSAFHRVLYQLSSRVKGESPGSPERHVTDGDTSRILALELSAVLSDLQRTEWTKIIVAHNGAAAGLEERLLHSAFARQVSFHFASGPGANLVHLTKTMALGEDGEWMTFHTMTGASETSTPAQELASFKLAATGRPLTQAAHFNDPHTRKAAPNLALTQWTQQAITAQVYLQRELTTWLTRAFFFQPDRKSTEQMMAQAAEHLDLRGANLAQVLHTIHSNDRPRFRRIEQFIAAGLPGLGELHTPLEGNATHVAFQFSPSGRPVRLHEMGGGIEQVLMLAVVLTDRKVMGPIFMDEPESHLHPRAQRFVAEQLRRSGRQVFVSTHAAVFAERAEQCSLFRMGIKGCRSTVSKIAVDSDLAEVLSDLGYRLADLTFAERVLFVEGPVDEAILRAWDRASVINHSNVALIHMNGAPLSHLRARGHALREASKGLRVPFHFLIDRDETSQEDIDRLRAELGDCITRLPCREIENLLLDATALAACLAARVSSEHRDAPESAGRQETVSADLIAQKLDEIVISLRHITLAKHLKHWFKRRALTSAFSEMQQAQEAHNQWKTVDEWCAFVRMASRKDDSALLGEARAAYEEFERHMEQTWSDPSARRLFAPGTEVLDALYKSFGLKYSKSNDGPLIAQQMAQVPPVIVTLLAELAKQPG